VGTKDSGVVVFSGRERIRIGYGGGAGKIY